MKIRSGDPAFTIVLLFLVCLLGEVDYQIIPPLLPLLATAFQVQPGYAGRVVPVYSFSAGVFSLLFGYLSDQHGRKPFIKYGLVGFSVATLFMCLSSSLGFLFLARFLTGITTGALSTCATSYAADFFHYQRRGRAMGILAGAYFVAAIIAVPVATAIAGSHGWRPLFWTNFGVALLTAFLISRFLEGKPPSESQDPVSRDRLGFGHIKKVLDVYLKRKETSAILLASLLSSGAIVGFITYLGSHLNNPLHIPIQRIGLLFLCAGLTSLIGAPLSGVLSDKWGKKTMLVLSGVVLGTCLLVIPRLSWNLWLYVAVGLAGLAMAFRMAPLVALLTELVRPQERGTFLALRNGLSQLGIAVSTFVASYCYLYGGYQAVGLFTATLMVVSTLLVLFLVEEPRH